MNPQAFQQFVIEKGQELYRPMPWRENTDPYYVLVSELMLQQTQVDRVIPKFNQFIEVFPDIASLANAPLSAVLLLWSGLGYNRRAKFLHEAAKKVMADFGGAIPSDPAQLTSLPGVGVNTAGAIAAYAFNQPTIFIETNVRTVFFYHFFSEEPSVDDAQIKALAEQCLDKDHPREWYWALMDYGASLKKQGAGAIQKSRHYKKQSPLKGSLREVRGMILKRLATDGALSEAELKADLPDDERFAVALKGLASDGLIVERSGRIDLP